MIYALLETSHKMKNDRKLFLSYIATENSQMTPPTQCQPAFERL